MSELGDSVKIWQELSSIEREILKRCKWRKCTI